MWKFLDLSVVACTEGCGRKARGKKRASRAKLRSLDLRLQGGGRLLQAGAVVPARKAHRVAQGLPRGRVPGSLQAGPT